jgi:hypothetical protein
MDLSKKKQKKQGDDPVMRSVVRLSRIALEIQERKNPGFWPFQEIVLGVLARLVIREGTARARALADAQKLARYVDAGSPTGWNGVMLDPDDRETRLYFASLADPLPIPEAAPAPTK